MANTVFDVIIIGAGPAGLSAALILGRCRRRVLVIDSGEPRNGSSKALHGFITRDGVDPHDLRRLARQELARYQTIEMIDGEATRVRRVGSNFEVKMTDGRRVRCRKLLLATGVVDELPPLQGIEQFYGRSVFHCPYCDGWEFREQPLAVYSRSSNGVGLALELKLWTNDVVLCTDGAARLSSKHLQRLAKHKIDVRQQRVQRLEGHDGQLAQIVFADGTAVPRRALFFSTGQHQRCDIAARLGCGFTRKGAVNTGRYEATAIPGLYVAGDASRLVQLAIVAASEGAQAAFAINTALMSEDCR